MKQICNPQLLQLIATLKDPLAAVVRGCNTDTGTATDAAVVGNTLSYRIYVKYDISFIL